MIILTVADIEKLQKAINNSGQTVEKIISLIDPPSCSNCKYKDDYFLDVPCTYCFRQSKWEARP